MLQLENSNRGREVSPNVACFVSKIVPHKLTDVWKKQLVTFPKSYYSPTDDRLKKNPPTLFPFNSLCIESCHINTLHSTNIYININMGVQELGLNPLAPAHGQNLYNTCPGNRPKPLENIFMTNAHDTITGAGNFTDSTNSSWHSLRSRQQ